MEALKEPPTRQRERVKVEKWNDDRLDELSRRVEGGFSKVDRDMKEGFKEMREAFVRVEGKMEEGFVQTNERIDQTNHRIDQTNHRIDRLLQALFVGALGALVTLGATLLGSAVL